MDSLITAAARALTAGDPLGALNCVALRDDPSALALRGIAMAQLGDLVRAKALLQRAVRGFDPRETLARARCVVAEAEIALVSRDLGWPAKTLGAARAALEKHGDWVIAAHERHLEARSLLLIGRLDEAERALAELDPARLPPALRAAHELAVAGIAMRRLLTKVMRAAPNRVERAAHRASIPALAAEAESASLDLVTPAARLIMREGGRNEFSCSTRSKHCFHREYSWWTRAVSLYVTHIRWSRSRRVRYCSRLLAPWARRGLETCRETCSFHALFDRRSPMNRIARGYESKWGDFARCF
jgi:hypothetical protein